MTNTLAQLRDAINQKIVEQGESAPVAAFIFTSKDIASVDDVTYPENVVKEVLIGAGDNDYIYDVINEWMQCQLNNCNV
jgi:hypothetical protein